MSCQINVRLNHRIKPTKNNKFKSLNYILKLIKKRLSYTMVSATLFIKKHKDIFTDGNKVDDILFISFSILVLLMVFLIALS